MDRIAIRGGNVLTGILPISGAKNAALPLMIASLLTAETLTIENLPILADVEYLIRILSHHGVDYMVEGRKHDQLYQGRKIHFTAKQLTTTNAPYELVSKMRASFWLIGPLLARMGHACVALPGGCAIGTRPVDFILQGLSALGAKIEIKGGEVHASARKQLKGGRYCFPKVTVGGTHVMLMAACLAEGETILENVAQEPEIVNLIGCLNAMGAKIAGAGTSILTINGVSSLHKAQIAVIPDRIEAGTYAMAVAMAGGDVLLQNADSATLSYVVGVLRSCGVSIEPCAGGLRVCRPREQEILPATLETAPYPGFPTDLQAQMMALLTRAKGYSFITERIFENRFMHVQELVRLGAKISLHGQTARIEGVKNLYGAQTMATDLRASASLVIAGLAAQGETIINRVYHLDRGFEQLEVKLSNCGADIERLAS